ncbi:hypothetical protein SAY87_000749 [Trapa incisa]|uniref:Uncharacterized protein n=2 Tax=Trapa TaxID=22665 RepID=A0AAN7RDK9_TRANT|nr:hypothetical protein SAY87_000749 [Trapa incisa]KAK4801724.1 hypothetical protein SAY86_022211 [Trapa natans]
MIGVITLQKSGLLSEMVQLRVKRILLPTKNLCLNDDNDHDCGEYAYTSFFAPLVSPQISASLFSVELDSLSDPEPRYARR